MFSSSAQDFLKIYIKKRKQKEPFLFVYRNFQGATDKKCTSWFHKLFAVGVTGVSL